MAKTSEKLSALFVRRADKEGLYGDGLNLWLKVTPTGTKSWVFRYTFNGKSHSLGLGAAHTISLAEAREKAAALRRELINGNDPKREKQAAIANNRKVALNSLTFDQCAEKFIQAKESGWKNTKHRDQWQSTLNTYASPKIGALPIDLIDTSLIKSILEPIWESKTTTASRVQQRMAKVFDWAISNEYRKDANPARWKGHLENSFTHPGQIINVRHQPSLDWQLLPKFMKAIEVRGGISNKALAFLILTAARGGEVRFATWDEIDLKQKIWTVPADRMKMKKPHIVPLSTQAIEVLKSTPRLVATDLIFPSLIKPVPISDAAMAKLIKDLHAEAKGDVKKIFLDKNGDVIVPHGFRASFKTWASEETNYKKDAIEFALAHRLPDKVEASYLRSTLFDDRVKLMNDWAKVVYG